MKTLKIVLAITIGLGVLLFLGACATTKTSMPTDNIDELLGTWVNPEYEGQRGPTAAKAVWKEDGSVGWYIFIESGNTLSVEHTDVKEKWMDRKGAVYFKAVLYRPTPDSFTNALIKIDSSRATLELLYTSRMEFLPSEMDPDAPYCVYLILYRQ